MAASGRRQCGVQRAAAAAAGRHCSRARAAARGRPAGLPGAQPRAAPGPGWRAGAACTWRAAAAASSGWSNGDRATGRQCSARRRHSRCARAAGGLCSGACARCVPGAQPRPQPFPGWGRCGRAPSRPCSGGARRRHAGRASGTGRCRCAGAVGAHSTAGAPWCSWTPLCCLLRAAGLLARQDCVTRAGASRAPNQFLGVRVAYINTKIAVCSHAFKGNTVCHGLRQRPSVRQRERQRRG